MKSVPSAAKLAIRTAKASIAGKLPVSGSERAAAADKFAAANTTTVVGRGHARKVASGVAGKAAAIRDRPMSFNDFRKQIASIDRADAVSIIRGGIEARLFSDAAKHLSVSKGDFLGIVGIHPATFARKESASARMDSAPSERLVRIASVEARAIEVFGSEVRAAEWLRTPNFGLGDQSPLAQLDTDLGAESVRQILNAIAYGGVV